MPLLLHRLLPNYVNARQFVRNVQQYGGGSRSVLLHRSTNPGFYVSRYPQKSIVKGGSPERKLPVTTVNPKRLVNLVRLEGLRSLGAVPSTPFREIPNLYQGAWTHQGKLYLDISDRVDDFATAVAHGLARKQEGVYDARTQDVFRVMANTKTVPHPELASTVRSMQAEINTPGSDARTELSRRLLRPAANASNDVVSQIELTKVLSHPDLQWFVVPRSKTLSTGFSAALA
jgi:hypothetical protein